MFYSNDPVESYLACSMLSLQQIDITHFKNYEFSSFRFNKTVIGICGLNGKGKTNLLDAIYYCCFTKSYFASSDTLNIGFGKEGFRLEADFNQDAVSQKVLCIHRGNSKKEFYFNDIPYVKFSKHIGLLPAVIIAPDDINIISGNSEERRKYLDTLLCQLDADYLQQLIIYNKILLQRNSLLKRFAEQGNTDDTLLEVMDQQLIAAGNYIFDRRKKLSGQLIPLVIEFYLQIASNSEKIHVGYESKLHLITFAELLNTNREKDRQWQRTTAGIHKDDLAFELDKQPFRHIASQGQRKSLLFALKLAEYEMIKQSKGFPPLLLLDDVFEKLDDIRMNNLMNQVCKENKGQVFITDTHKERLEEAFTKLGVEGQIIEL